MSFVVNNKSIRRSRTLEKLTMTDAMMGQLMSLLGTGFSFISQHLEVNMADLLLFRL